MATTFYGDIENDICLIDTRGTEDSDKKTDDKEILNGIQKLMHDYSGSMCKIIWVVHSAERGNKHLRTQVEFIQELGNGTQECMNEFKSQSKNDFNIWDHVLMIVNKPKVDVSLHNEIKGINYLASEYGCPKDNWEIGKNLIGFTCLSWLEQACIPGSTKDKEVKKMKKRLKKELNYVDSDTDTESEPGHHGNSLHYYYEQDIKKLVYDILLKRIKSFKILSLNYQCIRCGIIGNPKFVTHLKCHTKCQKYHPNNFEARHFGDSRKKVHPGSLIYEHRESLKTRYHSGKIESRHTSDSVFSTGGKVLTGITSLGVGIGGGVAVAAGIAASGTTFVYCDFVTVCFTNLF